MRRTVGIVVLVAVTTVGPTPAHAAGKPAPEITSTVESPALIDGGGAPTILISASDQARGRFANVDLVTFPIGGRATDLAVVTDHERDQLRIYRVEASGHLTDITADDAPRLFTRGAAEDTAPATGYGLATYGRYAVVSRPLSGRLGIFRLQERAGRVTYRATDTLDLPEEFRRSDGSTWSPVAQPRVEELVVDSGVLYATQENVALWRIRLDGDQFAGLPRVVRYADQFGADAAAVTYVNGRASSL